MEFVILWAAIALIWLLRKLRRPPLPPVGHAYVPERTLRRFLRLEKRR